MLVTHCECILNLKSQRQQHRDHETCTNLKKSPYERALSFLYSFTYRFDGIKTDNNMNVYMNGELRPEAEVEEYWPATQLPKEWGFSGTMELGNLAPHTGWALGSMWMDELLIYEEELPCDDILRLYHAYV